MSRGYLLYLAEEERLRNYKISRPLQRTPSNPLELPSKRFVEIFRLRKSQFLRLCKEIFPLLRPRRRSAVHPELKVLATLAFYANGGYQKCIGTYYELGLCQTTVHVCLSEVTEALNNPEILAKYIKFPTTRKEMDTVKRKFMDKYQLPGVLGCIDGTHIGIIRPSEHEKAYLNSKQYHSLNVLIICDADLRILYLDASFGGDSRDSFVWDNCPVLVSLQELHEAGDKCCLLGDSGYAQKPWMMTPIEHTIPGTPEQHYTIYATIALTV